MDKHSLTKIFNHIIPELKYIKNELEIDYLNDIEKIPKNENKDVYFVKSDVLLAFLRSKPYIRKYMLDFYRETNYKMFETLNCLNLEYFNE